MTHDATENKLKNYDGQTIWMYIFIKNDNLFKKKKHYLE